MAAIAFDHVCKQYEAGASVVEDLSLHIDDGELLVLVGPSGCGKSTALRMIAGLEDVSRGTLSIGGRVVNDVPPKERDVAMVFQTYALYPHMTCFENMAFALVLRGVPRAEVKRRVETAARSLAIEHLLGRKPRALSGGQQQRVAIGRAIVREPAVLLMDEPLSNLDASLRTTMRAELKRLHRRLRTTFVYVTHDQTEALTLGDRIAVLHGGVLLQCDTPQRIYDAPACLFVATFIGTPPMNLIPADLAFDGETSVLAAPGLRLAIPRAPAHREGPVIAGVRPEHLQPADGPLGLKGTVELVESMGFESHVHLRMGDEEIVHRWLGREGLPTVGAPATLTADPATVHLFDPRTEARL
ncbi:MAG: sn-glycerol-3-phosphate ABC transporter ATP-binding protein UgpC [Minicystis sp.]